MLRQLVLGAAALLLALAVPTAAGHKGTAGWGASLTLATADVSAAGAPRLCFDLKLASSSSCIPASVTFSGMLQRSGSSGCNAIRSTMQRSAWTLDGSGPLRVSVSGPEGRRKSYIATVHFLAGTVWGGTAGRKLCVVLPPAGPSGSCSTWAALFGGALNSTYTLSGTPQRSSSSSTNSAGSVCAATGQAATGLPPTVRGTMLVDLQPQGGQAGSLQAAIAPLAPGAGVIMAGSAPVTRIVAVTDSSLGTVTIVRATSSSGADSLRYTSKPGSNGLEYVSFLAQAADGQQAAAMILVRVNSSEPMQPPANHKPTPRNFTTTTLVDRYVTITVLAPELYWGLDPDSTDLPGLKLAGAGPAAKGGIVEIVQLTGNDTGIRYTPPTNFSGTDIFPYSLTDGLATATAYITVRVTSRPPSGGVTGVDPCGSVCDSKHIIVNNPNDTKAGQAGNSAVVYSGMTDGIAEVISSSRRMAAPQGKVPEIATSILKKIGMAIVQGIKGPKEDKATWLKYELEKDLSQMEDYLVCEMNSIVGNAFYAAGQQMQQQHVYDFNNAINGVQDYLMDGCGSRNCLNYTQLAPRLRNDASGMNCVIGHKSNGCSSVASWDYNDPVLCTWVDATSGSGTGICDPVTKLCYESSVSFSGVIDYYAKTIIPTFLQHPAINYFHAFDQYDSVDAVSAVAKGAALYMVLLQELILLGSPGGENATMIAFAKRMADYLEPRYQYHTDEARLRNLVTSTSYTTGPMKFTNCNNGGCNNCPYVPDYWREQDCCTGWQCSTDMVTVGGVTMYTGNFRIRQGCSKNLVSVSCDYLAWGHDKNHNCYGTCARMADLNTGSCNRLWCNRTLPECAPESYYSNDCKCGQVDWWQGLDQGFRALRDDVTAQLANVTVIISAMHNISRTGLPMELFGLYQSSYYPLASCDLGNATSMRSGSTMQGSNTSTGSSSSSSSTATSDSTHTGGPEQLFGTARGVESSNPGPAAAAAALGVDAAAAAAPRADAPAASADSG